MTKAKRRRATVPEVLDLCVDLAAADEQARSPALTDELRARAERTRSFAISALCGLDLVELRDRVRKAER